MRNAENKTWRPPSEPSGGQCIAVDENGEECCAFYSRGKWHMCTNLAGKDYEFEPRAWMPLPRYKEPRK